MAAGETADDCADPDRLIAYDDDLGFLLFDVDRLHSEDASSEQRSVKVECLKFQLICGLFACLGWLRWDNESLDLSSSSASASTIGEDDDARWVESMIQASHLDDSSASIDWSEHERRSSLINQDMPLCGRANFLPNLLSSLRTATATAASSNTLPAVELKQLLADTTRNAIGFVRRTLDQALRAFATLHFRTNCTLLKWRFELYLLSLLATGGPLDRVETSARDSDDAAAASFFDLARIKE
jgi:hypothetical protein